MTWHWVNVDEVRAWLPPPPPFALFACFVSPPRLSVRVAAALSHAVVVCCTFFCVDCLQIGGIARGYLVHRTTRGQGEPCERCDCFADSDVDVNEIEDVASAPRASAPHAGSSGVPACAASAADASSHVYEYHIAFSESFCVPVLLIKALHASGVALSLDEIWNASCLARHTADRWTVISLGEHPLLADGFFWLHPCRTAELVRTLGAGEALSPVEQLVLWLSAYGPAVGLHVPPLLAERRQ